MVEIPEVISLELTNRNNSIDLCTTEGGCKLTFDRIDMSDEEIATMAWLLKNKTKIKLEISQI